MDDLRDIHVEAMKLLRNLPRPRKEYIEAFENGSLLLSQASINTPRRMGHFLAQVITESDGLAYAREDMNYSPKRLVEVFGVGQHSANITQIEAKEIGHCPTIIAERVYGKGNVSLSKKMGNVYAGDGWKFRGGGLIQLTGRANYQMVSDATKIDFVNHPDWIAQSMYALVPPCWFWSIRNINTWCDANDIGMVTKKVNGGVTGLADRILWFNRFCVSVPLAGPPIHSKKHLPRSPSNICFFQWLQKMLNHLVQQFSEEKYPSIMEDGILGERTVHQWRLVQSLFHMEGNWEYQTIANTVYSLVLRSKTKKGEGV